MKVKDQKVQCPVEIAAQSVFAICLRDGDLRRGDDFAHSLGIDLFLRQQGIDTTTPAGQGHVPDDGRVREFERSVIRERVNAGGARARADKHCGRPSSRPSWKCSGCSWSPWPAQDRQAVRGRHGDGAAHRGAGGVMTAIACLLAGPRLSLWAHCRGHRGRGQHPPCPFIASLKNGLPPRMG